MTFRSILALSIISLLGASACARESVEEEVEYTFDFTPGQTLSVNTHNGGITLDTWNRDQVHIYVHKKAKANTDEEAEELLETTTIEIAETSPGISIRTERQDKWKLFKNRNITVNYTIKVPQQIHLELQSVNGNIESLHTIGEAQAKTVNGQIEIHDTRGNIEANTVNGKIELTEIHGAVRAKTVNGQIEIEIVEQVDDNIEAETVNGKLQLTLPADFQGRLQAKTMNGGINTEFPITVKGHIGKSLSGDLNGGEGPSIQLKTLNGRISIDQI